MRPVLTSNDVSAISTLALSFYRHYSDTYYGGREDRLHLMKYTIHLLLHIGFSTAQCGTLVSLSQFLTERFIGVVKEYTQAKSLYAESVALRWIFEQSLNMCHTIGNSKIPSLRSKQTQEVVDRRSSTSDNGIY